MYHGAALAMLRCICMCLCERTHCVARVRQSRFNWDWGTHRERERERKGEKDVPQTTCSAMRCASAARIRVCVVWLMANRWIYQIYPNPTADAE